MKARYETMGIRLEQRPWRMFRLSSRRLKLSSSLMTWAL